MNKSNSLYHLSENNMNDKTLIPRVPDNHMTKNGYEENKTPRVSLAKTIDGCLRGMSYNLEGKVFYIHVPVNSDIKLKTITNKEVPDQSITGEVWAISKVKLKCVGKIKVIKDKGEAGLNYSYGDHLEAELYDWDWKWIDRYNINESTNVDISDKIGKCQGCGASRNWKDDGTFCECGTDHIIHLEESSKDVGKVYNENDIIDIEEKNITKTFFMDIFGTFDDKPLFHPYDIIKIPPGKYGKGDKKNKNEFTTTIGIWLFNKYCIEPTLFDVLGYINETVDGKYLDKINKIISYAILEDVITVKDIKPFLMKQQQLMRLVTILSPNHSMKMLTTATHISKKKKELIDTHKEELKAGNEIISAQVEKELLDYALDYLGDDDSLDMYRSSARSSLGNNFKNMFIMRGAIMNPDPDKGFDIATSSLIDGISKDEYAMMSNSLVAGAYAKAKNTATGGHMAKQYINAFQHITLDKKGSDCGTKRYIEVELNDKTVDNYMYSYIITPQGLEELNSKNISKFNNRKVKLRFSSLCESKTGICNKCVGNLFYILDRYNIGMVSVIIPNKIMNLSMKKFHDQQIRLSDMDVGKAFGV